jgi:antitoxin component YwqK of YwqJK toxin-antitoxin module
MKKLELTKDELEKLYYLPPKDVEKETEFQITYRMGRNSLVLELIKKIDEELTPYIEYHDNGNVAVKGQKNSVGQEEGIWEFFYSNGNIQYSNGNIQCRTPYKEGKADGIQEVFYESGNIHWRTPYKEGKRDGIQEWFDEQGNITKTTLWKNGEIIEETKPELTPHIEYYLNGNVKVKGQRNSKGQREGLWEWFYENGNILLRTPFKEGKEDGIEEWFWKELRNRCRTPFKGGKVDGIETFYDEQGNIVKTTLWKDGELIEETKPELTPHIEYYDNGNVWVKGQKNSKGEREGLWEIFYEDGNIFSRAPYKDGKIDGIDEWFYTNGNIHFRTPFKDGNMDGIQEEFNEQGNIVKTTLWKEGELIETTEPELTPYIMYHNNGNVWIKGQRNSKGQEEGIWEEFYENGNIECRIPYKEDKRDGIMEWFDEQGNITLTRLWKDGKLIEETKPKPQPDPQLIDFMAMRYRHDFGFLDEKHKESIRITMKQLWEEVVGLGFYKPKLK